MGRSINDHGHVRNVVTVLDSYLVREKSGRDGRKKDLGGTKRKGGKKRENIVRCVLSSITLIFNTHNHKQLQHVLKKESVLNCIPDLFRLSKRHTQCYN